MKDYETVDLLADVPKVVTDCDLGHCRWKEAYLVANSALVAIKVGLKIRFWIGYTGWKKRKMFKLIFIIFILLVLEQMIPQKETLSYSAFGAGKFEGVELSGRH